jgi:hypothetical protein
LQSFNCTSHKFRKNTRSSRRTCGTLTHKVNILRLVIKLPFAIVTDRLRLLATDPVIPRNSCALVMYTQYSKIK